MENKNFENLPEILEKYSLEELAEELGFKETEEMVKLRNKIVESMKAGVEFKELYLEYEDLAIKVVNQYYDENFKKAQIAHLIIEASIFRDGERLEDYKEKIDQALEYARGMRYDDVEKKIKKITST